MLLGLVLCQLLLLASSNPVAHQKHDSEDGKPKPRHHRGSHHHHKSHRQKKASDNHDEMSDAQMPEAARVVEEKMDKKPVVAAPMEAEAIPEPVAHDPLEKVADDNNMAKPLENQDDDSQIVKSDRVMGEEKKKRDEPVMDVANKPAKVEEVGHKIADDSNLDGMAKPVDNAEVGGVKSARVEEEKKSKKDHDTDLDIVKRMLKDQSSKTKLSEDKIHSHGEAVKREASLFGDVDKMTDEERKLLLELEKQRGLAADRTKQEEEEERRKRLMEELSPIKESGKKEGEDRFKDFKLESGLESLKAKQEEKSSLDDLMKKAKDKDSRYFTSTDYEYVLWYSAWYTLGNIVN